MAGRLGEGTEHELRIHGVAGTPPEGMLDDLILTHPEPDNCGRKPSGIRMTVSARRVTDSRLRAYSWGSLTSGSARAALYLLLVPYLMVNLAGWASLPGQAAGAASLDTGGVDRPMGVRVVTALVRLTGILLTVIFAVWVLLICADLLAYQAGILGRGLPTPLIAGGIIVTGLVVETVFFLTRIRIRPGGPQQLIRTDNTDPVGYGWLTKDQGRLWNSPGILAHQRQIHRAVGLGVVSVIATLMVADLEGVSSAAAQVSLPLGAVAAVAGVGLSLLLSLSNGRRLSDLWEAAAFGAGQTGRLAVLAAAVTAWPLNQAAAPPLLDRSYTGLPPESMVAAGQGLSMEGLEGMQDLGLPVILPFVRDSGVLIVALYVLLAVLAGAVAWWQRDRSVAVDGRWAGWNLPAFLLLGGAVGGGLGAAAAASVARWAAPDGLVIIQGPMPEALAISFAALAILVGWVLLIGLAVQIQRPDDGRWLVAVTSAVQRMLRGGSWLMATLTGLGIVGSLLLIALAVTTDNALNVLDGLDPAPQIVLLTAVGLPVAALGLVLELFTDRVKAVLAVVIVMAVATWVVASLPGSTVAGVVRSGALAIGLITPASLVVGKGVSALRSKAERQSLAILWDIGTFFPRWFHPLTPPSYGDHVVSDLTDLLEESLDADHTLVLSPHSQGTVIAAVAVLNLGRQQRTDGLALLTHGSPLRQFYGEFFPRLFGADMRAALHERLGGQRWRNLRRTSDPIAAPVEIDGVDVTLGDPCSRIHSNYAREPEYATALEQLRAAITGAPKP